MCGPGTEPTQESYGYKYPSPGWCMTAEEEACALRERGNEVPPELEKKAADGSGI